MGHQRIAKWPQQEKYNQLEVAHQHCSHRLIKQSMFMNNLTSEVLASHSGNDSDLTDRAARLESPLQTASFPSSEPTIERITRGATHSKSGDAEHASAEPPRRECYLRPRNSGARVKTAPAAFKSIGHATFTGGTQRHCGNAVGATS
jgi:hypothetical protein